MPRLLWLRKFWRVHAQAELERPKQMAPGSANRHGGAALYTAARYINQWTKR